MESEESVYMCPIPEFSFWIFTLVFCWSEAVDRLSQLEYPQYVCFFRIILPLFVEDLLKQEDSLYCVDQNKKSTIYLQSASFTFLISADAGKYIFNVATNTRKTSESIVVVAVILNMYLPDNIFSSYEQGKEPVTLAWCFLIKIQANSRKLFIFGSDIFLTMLIYFLRNECCANSQ